jgi:predicted RNA binding protein YcfA (HicA-like mRNA interferase family)
MKRRDLIKKLEANGWYLERNGANHDIYTNGKDAEPIPRHSEIKENMAKAIIKKWGLK